MGTAGETWGLQGRHVNRQLENTMAYETVVALFETRAAADEASNALVSEDLPQDAISIFDADRLVHESGSAGMSLGEPALWRRLFGPTFQDHEAAVYQRAVERGGAILAARVVAIDVGRFLDVLESFQPLDVKERSDALLKEARDKGEQAVQLLEERLEVGKRTVRLGTTRVRRYVIESPVEAEISLHEEHAEILRRAAADPSFIADADWADQTIEIEETAEQAVVVKHARVAEEVVIRKTASDRVETVRDTVRKQEVDIERIPFDETSNAYSRRA
jgi:uncharacterized protein (TIGR02271 family)